MARTGMPNPFRKAVWMTTLVASLPALVAFVVLLAIGEIGGWAALGAAAAAVLGTWLVVHALVATLDRASTRLRRHLDPPATGPAGRAADIGGAATGWLVPWPAAAIAEALRDPVRQAGQERAGLRDELEALHRLVEAAPAAFLLVDQQRHVVLANRAAALLLGRQAGRGPLTGLFRDPVVLDAVDEALNEGRDSRATFETAGLRDGDEDRIMQAFVRPVSGHVQGERVSAIIVIEDLTQARRMDRMRADFIANASHELRTPLSTLAGYIETLLGPAGEDPGARNRFLSIMDSQAARMARLLEDLMSLSRIESMEDEKPTDVVDLRWVVQEQVEALQLGAGENGVALRIDFPGAAANGALSVIGDRDQLTQVVQNLLDNAIKYSRTGTEVTVSVAREDAVPGSRDPGGSGETVRLSVSDEGEGIPPEYLDRVTERFFRVDAGRSRELGGTGLGLAIVKHIISRHGGRLELDSTLGIGSRFTVSLPAARQPAGMVAADQGGQAAEPSPAADPNAL